jgi:hypothetical protein
MTTPDPPASKSQSSTTVLSPFKHRWLKKDTKNNALAHSITAAKAFQDASDLTGVPFLKSVVRGFVIILENVQVRLNVEREYSTEHFDGQTVRKNDKELNGLVDRISAIIVLLRDKVKGQSGLSNRQIDKMCQSFYVYSGSPKISDTATMASRVVAHCCEDSPS